MADFNWDKWNLGWAVGLPKNEMWAKIRTGKNDESGEPTFQYEVKPDTSSIDPRVTDILAEHRFVDPAVTDTPEEEHCFCGWSGEVHVDHLTAEVEQFVSPAPVEVPKKAPAKRATKKASE
jgi:hypothetical protein